MPALLNSPHAPPCATELEWLMRLLDDDTPEVRMQVAGRLACCPRGDLSDWLAAAGGRWSGAELELLSSLLAPARRDALRDDWQVPSAGVAGLSGDWDHFEAMMRAVSDFLHDGVTPRQPLSDALDLLAEDADTDGCGDEPSLINHLFGSGRLSGNRENHDDPRNSDLAWVVANGRSNPIGLGIILILVARRLGLDVEGVNFPGHFLCRIHIEGEPWLVDCFDRGHLHMQAGVVANLPDITREQAAIIEETAGPGIMLARVLNNLTVALHRAGRPDDRLLIAELRQTLG